MKVVKAGELTGFSLAMVFSFRAHGALIAECLVITKKT